MKAHLSLFLLSMFAISCFAAERVNSVGIAMIDIPAGNFVMGVCKTTRKMEEENKKREFLGQEPLTAKCLVGQMDQSAGDDTTPQRIVTLTEFQLGKTPVTLGQFKKYIKEANRIDLLNDEFIQHNAYGDNAPVVMVSWDDAQSFIKWINKKEGGGYRLPSEAEWEYACRAGKYQKYCGSDSIDEVAWYNDNSDGRMHNVGGKKPNAWGLYDMSGNVSEWVQDCWNDTYEKLPSDGTAVEWGKCQYRLQRGGAWYQYTTEKHARATYRFNSIPSMPFYYFGFRIARSR